MPYVLPTPEPRRRWYNDVGEAQGTIARLLLAALSGGATGIPSLGKQPTQPTAQNPGQIQFPGGATTQTSPLEQAMMRQMGGAPTRTGEIVPYASGNQPGVTYKPPMRWGFGPDVDTQAKQQDIAYKQAQMQTFDPAYQANVLRMAQGLSPSPTATPGGSNQPAHYQDPSTGQLVMEYAGKKYRVTGINPEGKPLYEPL